MIKHASGDLTCHYGNYDVMIHQIYIITNTKHPQGSTPDDITHHHMDLTYTLTSMLTSCYDNGMLLWTLVHIIFTPCISQWGLTGRSSVCICEFLDRSW